MTIKGQPVNNMGDWSYEKITPKPYYWAVCNICSDHEERAETRKRVKELINRHIDREHGIAPIQRG